MAVWLPHWQPHLFIDQTDFSPMKRNFWPPAIASSNKAKVG